MLHHLLDLLFPPFCVDCHNLGNYLCQECQYKLRFYTQSLSIEIENPAVDALYACCTHTDGARQLVMKLKYHSAYALTKTIAQLMIEHIPLPDDIDILTAIPLHRRRRQERGFNQAELLARQLSLWLRIPYQEVIQRIKATSPQAKLSRADRLTHLHGAFQVKGLCDLVGATVAIVDDVATTGSTLNEAAVVLKAAGVKTVYGIVFAHGK